MVKLTRASVELVGLPNVTWTELNTLTNWGTRTAGLGSNCLILIGLSKSALCIMHNGAIVVGLAQRIHLTRVHLLEVEVLSLYHILQQNLHMIWEGKEGKAYSQIL